MDHIEKHCLSCGKSLTGRAGKKFCDNYCKSVYHYQKTKEDAPDFYHQVSQQLRQNRRILKEYNKAGKATVRCEALLAEGFDPNFFTHYWKNAKGEVYLFVFEYGFLKITEHDRNKYVLVQWQAYMKAGNS
ncbi:hypothetical protein V6R21_24560 [Limibacter armeniacum]|uniref:hypothetical protein n=1 Tax=Limibacter armeniacum TaxID=466084 RepID=UPI002FE54710